MIYPEQIRAARGLLDWSTADLAKQSGMTINGINKIERGHVTAHKETLEILQRTFEKSSIEFLDNLGVRIKPQGVEVLKGQKGLAQFFDNVYEYAAVHGGTIVQYGLEEDFLSSLGGDYAKAHRDRMTKLVEDRKDVKVLAIVCEGDTNFTCSDYNQYRWIPKELFSPVLFYIYGETTAIMNFQTVPAPTIILLKFPQITEACHKQFEIFWNMSKEPDVKQLPRK